MADVGAFLDLAYTKVVTRDESSNLFVAEAKELPGCVAHGETEAEALAHLRDAQASWIEGVLEQGKQPPLPKQSDLPSGKWLMRVPRTVHRQLIDIAEADDTSLNQLALVFLVEGIARRRASIRVQADEPRHPHWELSEETTQYQWKTPLADVSARYTDSLRENSSHLGDVRDKHFPQFAGGGESDKQK